MYPLLPLQIFKLRHEMESIKRSRGTNTQELNELILNAMETAQIVANESKALYEEEKINGEDLHKILLAVSNLFEYLNNKYGDNTKLSEEVLKMTKTLYDPEVEKRGIEQGENRKAIKVAENLLKLGVSEDIIVQSTELSVETIRELKKKIMN